MDFLVYAYLQSGREADAQQVIEEVKAMPAKKDDMYGMDFDPRTSALVTFTARYALEMHHWTDAASLRLFPVRKPGIIRLPTGLGRSARHELAIWPTHAKT